MTPDDKFQLIAIELEETFERLAKMRLRIETDTIELERRLVNAIADLQALIKDAKPCLPSP
jgi:hypothetical protein